MLLLLDGDSWQFVVVLIKDLVEVLPEALFVSFSGGEDIDFFVQFVRVLDQD